MTREKNGTFAKGNVPWNKGRPGSMGACRTLFTRETSMKNPSGTPYKHKRDGYVCLTDDRVFKKYPGNPKGYMYRKRTPYSHWVLKKAGIEIPKGHIVYHKDNDKFNDSIDNLEVITRAELMRRNKQQ